MTHQSQARRRSWLQIETPNERAAIRHYADVPTTILSSKGRWSAGSLDEISEEGCRIGFTGSEPPEAGDVIGVKLPSYTMATGRVIWKKNGKIGIRFVLPLSKAAVEDLVRRSHLNRLEDFTLQSR